MIDSKYTKYAIGVTTGQITAGMFIKQTCQRYLDWFERDDIEFRPDKADRVEKFINKLRHTDGQFYNQPFILQDWQAFMVYGIFGWYWKGTDKRVIRNAYIQLSRKCGKTSIASAIALYALIADGEIGAEVDLVSPSSEQTRIAFRCASNYAESINKGNIIKCLRNTIDFKPSKARIRMMSSDSKFGDGFSPHVGIVDEYHAFENNDIPNLIQSGQGMRRNPIMIYITTAGFNLHGPCKEYRDMCAEILNGTKTDDSIFPLIYELDEGDDWLNEDVWEKACPSLDKTVSKDYLRQQITLAQNNTSMETGVKTKNLNMWVSSSEVWLTDSLIENSMQNVNIEDYKGEFIYGGIDLGAVSDLCVMSFMIPPNPYRNLNPDKFIFKSWVYLPETELSDNVNWQYYRTWQKHKYLTVTSGNVTDYEYILEDMKEINSVMPIQDIAYDAWQSTMFVISATNAGMSMAPYSQAIGNFTKPTRSFEILLRQGKVIIDSNPITRWCFQNVVLKEDHNNNVKPTKTSRMQKIDIVIAMLESLGVYLDNGGGDITIS